MGDRLPNDCEPFEDDKRVVVHFKIRAEFGAHLGGGPEMHVRSVPLRF